MATDLLQYISDKKLHLPLRLMLDFELETGVEWPDLYDWLEKKGSCLVARLMEETSGDFRRYDGLLEHIFLSKRVVQSVIDVIRKSQKSHRVVATLTSGLGAEVLVENKEVQSAIAERIPHITDHSSTKYSKGSVVPNIGPDLLLASLLKGSDGCLARL
jgi:hypothetical protein